MARAPAESTLAQQGFGIVFNSTNPLYNPTLPATPLHITLASVRQHVIKANDRTGGARWDIFVHSWAPSLEAEYRREFNFTSAVFEDNSGYAEDLWGNGKRGIYHNESDWHQLSYALSISKAAALVLNHATRLEARDPSWRFYSRLVFVRADVLLTRDLLLHERPASAQLVYISGPAQPALTWRQLSATPPHTTGDMHHVFSTVEQVRLLARLPHLLARLHEPHVMHRWMWRVLTSTTRGGGDGGAADYGGNGTTRRSVDHLPELRVQTDGFVQGWDEDVYRHLPIAAMRCKGQAAFTRYGLSAADWLSLHPFRPHGECKGDVAKAQAMQG